MTGARYAEGTAVSPERSQMEISETLRRYGATGFMYGWEDSTAVIAFKAHDRHIRFTLELPSPTDKDFMVTPTGRVRDVKNRQAAYEAEIRRRWRALALAIKAKLEAVQTNITTFEDEFLSHIVMPDGTTVGEQIRPKVALAYETGLMPSTSMLALSR